MYPYEENALFLLILTVFLVRAHFFLLFFLFIRFQKSKKSVPLRGKCTFFTNFHCFPRKGTLFFTFFFNFSDFKRVKKVYPYEENALFLLILTVFLVRAHFSYSFLLFSDFKRVKKVYPYEENVFFLTNFDCFPRKGTLLLLFFYYFSDLKRLKKVYPYEENALFFANFDCFPRKGTLF